MRNRVALLVALGVDNFGSGLFLPLTLVYVTSRRLRGGGCWLTGRSWP
jgi:hypothetical protein